MRHGQPKLRVECMTEEAFGVDSEGTPNGCLDAILYDGPVSHAAAATCREYGYGIRAFPFAGRMQAFINLRIYDRSPFDAFRYARQLWTGRPAPGLHDFFVKRARMTFSRPMPFEIGGDAHGERTLIDFAVADRSVEILQWRPKP
jgi:hypothetical protein